MWRHCALYILHAESIGQLQQMWLISNMPNSWNQLKFTYSQPWQWPPSGTPKRSASLHCLPTPVQPGRCRLTQASAQAATLSCSKHWTNGGKPWTLSAPTHAQYQKDLVKLPLASPTLREGIHRPALRRGHLRSSPLRTMTRGHEESRPAIYKAPLMKPIIRTCFVHLSVHLMFTSSSLDLGMWSLQQECLWPKRGATSCYKKKNQMNPTPPQQFWHKLFGIAHLLDLECQQHPLTSCAKLPTLVIVLIPPHTSHYLAHHHHKVGFQKRHAWQLAARRCIGVTEERPPTGGWVWLVTHEVMLTSDQNIDCKNNAIYINVFKHKL